MSNDLFKKNSTKLGTEYVVNIKFLPDKRVARRIAKSFVSFMFNFPCLFFSSIYYFHFFIPQKRNTLKQFFLPLFISSAPPPHNPREKGEEKGKEKKNCEM